MSVLFLNINFKGNDKLSSSLEKINTSAKKLQSQIGETQKKLASLDKVKLNFSQFEKAKKNTAEAATKLTAYKKVIADLQRQMASGQGNDGIAKRLKNAEQEAAKLQNTVNKGRAKMNDLAASLEKAGYKGQSFSQSQKQLSADIEKANAALDRQRQRLDRIQHAEERYNKAKGLSDKMAGVATKSRDLAVKAGVGLAIPIKIAIDAESAMADVAKVVDGLKVNGKLTDEYKQFEKDMIAMSGRLGKSFEDVAAIIAGGAQGGIAKNELLAFGEHATKTAIAWGMEAGQVGQAVAELRASLNLSQKEVQVLADQINYLGNNSTNNAAFILEVVQRVGSVGAAAGVSGDMIAALGASISGVDASTVGTGLKNIIKSLTKGESATKSQRKAWQALGTTAEQMATEMLADPEKAIKKYIAMLGKLPDEQRLAFASMLSGDEALPVLSQLMNNPDVLNRFSADVKNKSKIDGSVDDEYASATATSGFKIDQAKSNIKLLAQQFGNILLPVVGDIADKISEIILKVQAWATANPKVFEYLAKGAGIITIILASVASLAALASAAVLPFAWLNFTIAKATGGVLDLTSLFGKLGSVAKGVGGVTKVFGVLKTAVFGVGKVFAKVGMMLLSNPILAIIAAIAVAGFLVYKNWDKIKPLLLNFWEGIKAKWAGFIDWVGDIWGGIKAKWAGFIDWVGGIWEGIKAKWAGFIDWLGDIWGGIKAKWAGFIDWVGGIWEGIKAGIKAKWDEIKAGIQTKLNEIWMNITAKFNAVLAAVSSIWQRIKATVQNAWNGLVAVFRNNAILSAIMGAFNSVFGWLSGLGARMRGIGTNIIDGLIGGIKSGFAKLKSVWSEINSYMPSFSRKAMDIHSPSRVMRRIGGFITDGLTVGIQKRFVPLKKTYDGMMGYLARPETAVKVAKFKQTTDKIGQSLGSDNFIADAVRMVAPSLSKNWLVSSALNAMPRVLDTITANVPKPAAVAPVQSAPAMMAQAVNNSNASHSQNNNYTINIQGTSGTDDRSLIMRLRAELDRIEQQKAARHRARLTD